MTLDTALLFITEFLYYMPAEVEENILKTMELASEEWQEAIGVLHAEYDGSKSRQTSE